MGDNKVTGSAILASRV